MFHCCKKYFNNWFLCGHPHYTNWLILQVYITTFRLRFKFFWYHSNPYKTWCVSYIDTDHSSVKWWKDNITKTIPVSFVGCECKHEREFGAIQMTPYCWKCSKITKRIYCNRITFFVSTLIWNFIHIYLKEIT